MHLQLLSFGFLNIMQAFESCKVSLEASLYVFSTNSESMYFLFFQLKTLSGLLCDLLIIEIMLDIFYKK